MSILNNASCRHCEAFRPKQSSKQEISFAGLLRFARNDASHGYRRWLISLLISVVPLSTAHAAEWQTPRYTMATVAETRPAVVEDAPKFYQITNQEVAREVARQLQLQGIERKATAVVNAMHGSVLYAANHPLQLVIHGLQIDPDTRRWQAQANVLNAHRTEVVKPVSGTYEPMASVPILIHQVSRNDVIAESDIAFHDIPARQLRKDTVTDAQDLIGKSPRAQISAERPIRKAELSMPVVIRRGDLVEMHFSAPYMQIKTTGIALDDGELGGMLRVKNTKSEKAISTRVVGAGKVEANFSS